MWYTFVKTIWWERWKNQELTYWKYDDHQLRQQDLATQQQWWSWNSKFYYSFSKCTFLWSDFIFTDFFAYLGPKIVLSPNSFIQKALAGKLPKVTKEETSSRQNVKNCLFKLCVGLIVKEKWIYWEKFSYSCWRYWVWSWKVPAD